MRLIDADDVKKRGDCYLPNVRSVISNILRHTKTIKDVAPVKHGHWKKISPAGIYECSNCKNDVMTADIDVYKYCHRCGCKMDEVSE